jgi:PadR family transcriptional regulator PadR
VLYRLERGRYVAVRWETPERGVPRKYYQLTEEGRIELERLKQEWRRFAAAMERLLQA